ncbi:MAG: HEPN domain-containing protein [bacterium]
MKKENRKYKPPQEWFRQADYDLETAKALLKSGRYIYTVFMCHLCIEKALKGLYAMRFEKDPEKIHNLNYFCEKIKLDLNEKHQNFIDNLNDLSVPTRYPDDLEKHLKEYKKDATEKVFNQTKVLLLCLKKIKI